MALLRWDRWAAMLLLYLAGPAVVALAALVLFGAAGWRDGMFAGLAAVSVSGLIAARQSARRRTLALRLRESHVAAMSGADRVGNGMRRGAHDLAELWADDSLFRQAGRFARRVGRTGRDLERDLHTLESALAALDDALVFIGSDGRILRVNEAAYRLMGTDLVGRTLHGILRNPQLLDAITDVQAGEAARSVEFALPVPTDQRIRARIAGGPGTEASGRPPLVIVTLRDITEMKRSEDMRRDFISNASHELRTPLTSLAGFIETMRGPARDDEEAREKFLEIMAEQAGRMSRLIADLMSLSRIELVEHTPPADPVDIADVARAAIEPLQLKAASRSMTIRRDIDRDLSPVQGDADQLVQVIQNLVDNSLSYARAGTEVVVSIRLQASRLGPVAAVRVADQGEGIPQTALPRLTERFYRVDTGRSRSAGGTGLGLAIVKHILNRHRSRLSVESIEGVGTFMSFELPIAPDALTKRQH